MKILHVIPDLAAVSGGPVSAVLGMARAQSEAGNSVTIVSTNFGQLSSPSVLVGNDRLNIHLYSCDFSKWRWSSKLKEALYVHIKDSDIVHLHTLWCYPILAAADVCVKLGKSYILRPCGMLDPWSLSQKKWIKKLYLFCFQRIISQATTLHFTSEQERINSTKYIKDVRSFVCPLGVSLDENLSDAQAFRKRHPELERKLLILFLSRLHYKKQPEILIHAFRGLVSRKPDLRLVMAGSGDVAYVRQLKHLVNQLGLMNKVLFTGMLSGFAKQEALSAANVFVLPSLQENFGISVVEAMAAGCAVVVSDWTNIASDISRAEAGIVCPPTINEIESAIDKLVSNDKLRRQMGENGKKLCRDQFEWNIVTKSLLMEYERLLDFTNQENVDLRLSGVNL